MYHQTTQEWIVSSWGRFYQRLSAKCRVLSAFFGKYYGIGFQLTRNKSYALDQDSSIFRQCSRHSDSHSFGWKNLGPSSSFLTNSSPCTKSCIASRLQHTIHLSKNQMPLQMLLKSSIHVVLFQIAIVTCSQFYALNILLEIPAHYSAAKNIWFVKHESNVVINLLINFILFRCIIRLILYNGQFAWILQFDHIGLCRYSSCPMYRFVNTHKLCKVDYFC